MCVYVRVVCMYFRAVYEKSFLVKQLETSGKTPFPHQESQKAREGL